MTTEEVLVAARKLIEEPANWFRCGVDTSTENKYCARWAIEEAAPNSRAEDDALTIMRRVTGPYIASFNDSRTHPEVLAAFDRAIELARAAQ